jgi:hypothetical protein
MEEPATPACKKTEGVEEPAAWRSRRRGGAGRAGLQEEDRWRWLDWGEGEQEDDRRCRLDGEQLVAAGGVEEVGPEDRRVVHAGGDGGRLGGFLWAGAAGGVALFNGRRSGTVGAEGSCDGVFCSRKC